jgi:neutral ceramidase
MLQVGSASVDITPNLGCHLIGYFNDRIATAIHDPLHAKALAISNGEMTIGIVVCDLIAVPGDVVRAAKERIASETGVPPERVMICATHTHTGPSIKGSLGTPATEGYAEWVAPRIADAFIQASRQLRPAQVAFTRGNCASEVHNRRRVMKDGSVRMNPGYQHPEMVRPAGPTDPELGVLIFRSPDREPLGVLANLGLHYVGAGVHDAVSADYFAEFGVALQRIAGARFQAILANGCFGDINNCDFDKPARTSPDPYFQIRRVANIVAAEAWKAWNILREEDFRDEVPLGARLEMVPFKARVPSLEELAQAKARLAAGDDPNDHEWVYARELVLMESDPSEWDVPISAMRIGDLGLVGLPGEVFSQIGLDIKAASPFAQTMLLGLANGTVGYVATDQAMDEGSYETRLCRHVRAPKGTHSLWKETAVRLLNGLKG